MLEIVVVYAPPPVAGRWWDCPVVCSTAMQSRHVGCSSTLSSSSRRSLGRPGHIIRLPFGGFISSHHVSHQSNQRHQRSGGGTTGNWSSGRVSTRWLLLSQVHD